MSASVNPPAGGVAGKQIDRQANSKYRILVVDDEAPIRQTNSLVLIGAGYKVNTAIDGAAGWDALQADHFDLLITDNLMPKVSGIELINKTREAKMSIRVLVATGTLLAEEYVRNPWIKTVATLRKPYGSAELLSMVKSILDNPSDIQEDTAASHDHAPGLEPIVDRANFPKAKIPTKNDESERLNWKEKAEARLDRAEQRSDNAEARSEEAEARSDRAEARSDRSEMKGEQALRFSELRYRRLFEAARDGIMILDVATGRIRDVNPFLIELLGFSHSEMLGKTVAELSPFRDIEPNQAMLKRLQEHGYVRYENLPLETRDNRHISVEFVCNIYQEGDQKVIQCNIRDITERKNDDDQRRRLSEELEQRVIERTEELEAFSFSASHDLRVPLLHVLGFVKELREDAGPEMSEKSLGLLTTISRATERMGDLIDNLLDFSRTGLSDMRKGTVDLDALVRDTLGDFSAETEKRKIAWEIHPLPVVLADRALLRLVLVNLISNAIKFTGTQARPKIEIGSESGEKDEEIIYIKDNGAGFDPAYAHKLFGAFQRLHSQDEFEGTGLGLANIQRIIRRHGGRIWAKGAVDKGATFFFTLPKV